MSLDPFAVDQVIRDAQRFKDLLDSPVVGVCVKMLDTQYLTELKQATTDDAMRLVRAKASVVDDVLHALRVVMDAGERDAIEREQRERPANED